MCRIGRDALPIRVPGAQRRDAVVSDTSRSKECSSDGARRGERALQLRAGTLAFRATMRRGVVARTCSRHTRLIRSGPTALMNSPCLRLYVLVTKRTTTTQMSPQVLDTLTKSSKRPIVCRHAGRTLEVPWNPHFIDYPAENAGGEGQGGRVGNCGWGTPRGRRSTRNSS
jgi:hypothetical protein